MSQPPAAAPHQPDAGTVGVGPWVGPLPVGDRWDPDLLTGGDRRNVLDRYRYWRHAAIVADLDTRRHPLHVAVENWEHDFNIGSVIRTANAFNVAAFHIVGRRRWNRRGAMVTDRYQHEHHHSSVADLVEWAAGAERVDGGGDCRSSGSTTCQGRWRSRRPCCRGSASSSSVRRGRG